MLVESCQSPPGAYLERMETTLTRATAVEQSVWGLGASWSAVEICLLAVELRFFFCLKDDKGFVAHSGYIYLALAGNVSL